MTGQTDPGAVLLPDTVAAHETLLTCRASDVQPWPFYKTRSNLKSVSFADLYGDFSGPGIRLRPALISAPDDPGADKR